MSLEELRERIKDEVVLREGDVANYQWRQMGLVDEAATLNLSEAVFGQLVNQVSQVVMSDWNQIAGLRSDILELARERHKKLADADRQQIVDKAERAHLTRSFVVDTWLPALLQEVPDVPESFASVPPSVSPEPVRSQLTTLTQRKRPIPHSVRKESEPSVINQSSPERGKPLTTYETRQNFGQTSTPESTTNQPFVPDLFGESIMDNSRIISQTRNLIEGYAATRTVRALLGLAKKSITDVELWHGILSNGIRWTRFLFETLWRALVFVLGGLFSLIVGLGRLLGDREFWRTTGAVVRVIIVVAIGWKLWLWGREWSSKKTPTKPVTEVVQNDPTTTLSSKKGSGKGETKSGKAATDAGIVKLDQPVTNDPAVASVVSDSVSNLAIEQPTPPNVIAPVATVSKDYDQVSGEPGQYGERQARKGKFWGLWSDENGTWLIEPVYNDIGVFKNGKAAVSLNGQDYDIDRNDQRILN